MAITVASKQAYFKKLSDANPDAKLTDVMLDIAAPVATIDSESGAVSFVVTITATEPAPFTGTMDTNYGGLSAAEVFGDADLSVSISHSATQEDADAAVLAELGKHGIVVTKDEVALTFTALEDDAGYTYTADFTNINYIVAGSVTINVAREEDVIENVITTKDLPPFTAEDIVVG